MDESLLSFTAALASSAPTPGGGGAAALMGALAASLGAMASRISSSSPQGTLGSYSTRSSSLPLLIWSWSSPASSRRSRQKAARSVSMRAPRRLSYSSHSSSMSPAVSSPSFSRLFRCLRARLYCCRS